MGICIKYVYAYLNKKVRELNTIFYIFMFAIGATLGSFYTLAVYRIPLKQDITHTRSYCPKCNHKLNFWDLIPILSYIALGEKCRYCKEKIRPRYLILEISSGLAFLLYGIGLNIDLLNIEYKKVVALVFGMLFFSTIFIIIGIFKEHKKIQKSVFNFGIIVEGAYMIYLYILNTSIYRYAIYIVSLGILAMLNNSKKTNEIVKVLSFAIFMAIGVAEITMILL